uniref:CBS domain-containing protein n=2 Tax=unclassified Candidatus Kentrum TaxID=2643149 RepID=A0A451A6Y0_9GAMM|nr:MAG: CBS domain-containing protein [Candidatus Kentron sp. LPFa]VFK18494.1 MAG: CBS domain-containing protein [Candidatus Kentron sp. LPFa]VFK24192.1 MAG: CBS domain-containing protein [Candidatus Kentron sp. LPFa]VFK61784.1 MAG: CBS domain-containing protein [Candidatus Kentron sp. UNK]VFK69993.1 MAG: CBS domain-containing protein [Candidatus Kentron sp. UNK]
MSERKILRVRHVMKRKFDTVNGLATIKEALEKMQHVEVKCLIVEKRHEDDEYGILLLSDIARKVVAINRAPERVNVYEVMQKPVIAVDPGMDVRYCARLFDRFGISRTPVLEEEKVIGIVSFTDLVIGAVAPQVKRGIPV